MTSTAQKMFNSWQKAHRVRDMVDALNEKLKANGFTQEADDVEVALINMNLAIEKLSTKLLNSKRKY